MAATLRAVAAPGKPCHSATKCHIEEGVERGWRVYRFDRSGGMMLNLGRMAFFLLIGLTVVYVSLYFYWRSGIRMRLEEDWVMEGRPGDRDAWVEDRLAPQARRIRRWLVFLVYVLPLAALSVYVYVTN